jgi:hypothetical protein
MTPGGPAPGGPAVEGQVGEHVTSVVVRGPWFARAATAQTTCPAIFMWPLTWTPAVRLSGCQPRCARGTGSRADQAHSLDSASRTRRAPAAVLRRLSCGTCSGDAAQHQGWLATCGLGPGDRCCAAENFASVLHSLHHAPLTRPATSLHTSVLPAAGGVEAEGQPHAGGRRRTSSERQQLAHQPAAHPAGASLACLCRTSLLQLHRWGCSGPRGAVCPAAACCRS